MASTKVASKRRFHFLPYRYTSNGLKIEIKKVKMDGENITSEINSKYKRVDLADYIEWSELTLTGKITVPQRIMKDVVPEKITESLPVRITLALRSPKTHMRKAVWQEISSAGVGEYGFEFKLQKDKLYGKVGLKPYLIRTSSQNKSEEHAGHAGARLASARKWTLILDKEEGVTAGHMEIKYENFSELPSTGNCEDCLYHLNLEVASEPMLYINKEHEKIRQVLDNKGTRGSYARLREVLFDHISIELMIKLLLKAAGDIDEEGEVRYDWESEVLDPFIKEQYPEFDLYEARNHLKKYYWKEEGGVLELLNEIQLYNQKTYKLKTHIEKLIGEIK